MKIVIITGIYRPGGNSGLLADHFQKGGEEAGHAIFRFDVAHRSIHGCIDS